MTDFPVVRRVTRALIIDHRARLLLMKARQPDDGHLFWLAPGGALLSGETFEAAALREVEEETGLIVTLGPWVWERRHVHTWNARRYDQYERYFVARTKETDVRPRRRDGYIVDHRWWTLDEVMKTADDLVPRRLPGLLEPLLRGEYPVEPLDCGV